MTNKRTELNELGEFGLINRISKDIKLVQPSTFLGVGDDAAVIDINTDEYMLLSSDMLLEGVHFDLTYTPLMHLGYKSVAVNISDIAAMNGVPKQITVNIGLSNRFSVEAVDELYKGIKLACNDYGVDLVGGDTTSSLSGLVISVSVIGKVNKGCLSKRSGAAPDQVVAVTGDLGAAFLGLKVLQREKQEFKENPDMKPRLQDYDYVVRRQLKPGARTDIIYEMDELGVVPKAMIDVSDGLASELIHIAESSGVGIKIYEETLPMDRNALEVAMEFDLNPTTCMLNGGEDYELLMVIDLEDKEKLENLPDLHFIGITTKKEEGNFLITRNMQQIHLKAQGWSHINKD